MQLWRWKSAQLLSLISLSFQFVYLTFVHDVQFFFLFLPLWFLSFFSFLSNQQSLRQQCEKEKKKKWEKLQSHDIYRAIDVELFFPYDFMCYDLFSLARWGYLTKKYIRSKDVIIINLHDFFFVSSDWKKWNVSKGHKCL